jgi:hypothetical protein
MHAPRVSVSVTVYADQYGSGEVHVSEMRNVAEMEVASASKMSEADWLTLGAFVETHVERTLGDAKAQIRVQASRARERAEADEARAGDPTPDLPAF